MLMRHSANRNEPKELVRRQSAAEEINTYRFQPSTERGHNILPRLVSLLPAKSHKSMINLTALTGIITNVITLCVLAAVVTEPAFTTSFARKYPSRTLAMQTRQRRPSEIAVRLRAALTVNSHTSDTPLIRFSPDGRTLATGTGKEPVKLWDSKTGKLRIKVIQEGAQVPKAFSPDGRILATTGSGIANLVNSETGQLIARLAGNKNLSNADLVEFSPDGKAVLTYGPTNNAGLWDTQSGGLRAVIGKHKGPGFIEAVFSPNGQTIVTACDGDKTAKLWSATTGQLRASLVHRVGVHSVLFTADSRRVVTASLDDVGRIWDAETGQLRDTLQGHRNTIYEMALSPDGRLLATASRDGTAKLWDVSTGKLKSTLSGNDGAVLNVTFSADGRTLATLSGSKDQARLWNVETGELKATLSGHKNRIDEISFSPDERLLASSGKDAVLLWDAFSGEFVARLQGAHGPAEFSPDGRTLATGGEKGTVLLWDLTVK